MNPQIISLIVMMVMLLAILAVKKITGLPIFPLAMAVLTEDRQLEARESKSYVYGVADGAKIFHGAIVCKNATGYAVKGSADNTLIPLGISEQFVDNTDGGDGDLTVSVREGVFKCDNSGAADEITIAELGQTCYIVDDQTVAKTNGAGARPAAGYIRAVDDDGVWVEFKNTKAADGDVVAANNLSDLANPATARANIAANKVTLELHALDLKAADAKVYRIVSPVAGTIKKIYSVIDAALAGGDATLTGKIGAVAITGGVVTITQAGSAAGDVDVATPSALNVVAIGDVISLTVGGANTDATVTAKGTVYIET